MCFCFGCGIRCRTCSACSVFGCLGVSAMGLPCFGACVISRCMCVCFSRLFMFAGLIFHAGVRFPAISFWFVCFGLFVFPRRFALPVRGY